MKTTPQQEILEMHIDSVTLEGMLDVPKNAVGVVIFAHGSGSSRHSPRNTYVAEILRREGIGTFLFDLLTPQEDENYQMRFDITLLTERLIAATEWAQQQPPVQDLPLGYFGASTGAAAALKAAAQLGPDIKAVVSRGGRPDLAGTDLNKVKAATLLIVGSRDQVVLELNEQAFEKLAGHKELAVVAGATHLFEEPGALEEVSELATQWFKKHLRGSHRIISE